MASTSCTSFSLWTSYPGHTTYFTAHRNEFFYRIFDGIAQEIIFGQGLRESRMRDDAGGRLLK